MMAVQCPAGAAHPASLTVQLPSGQHHSVQIPPGVQPGQTFQVPIPSAGPAPVMQVSAVPVDARGPSGAAVPVMAMPAGGPSGAPMVLPAGSVQLVGHAGGAPDRPPAYAPTAPPAYAPAALPQGGVVSRSMGGRCPDITVDKAAWFQHFDKDGSGFLDLQELIHALATTFNKTSPSELASMSDTVGAIWCAFDMDMNAQISMREFTTSNGLADTIIATINHRQDRQNRAL